MVKKDFQIIEHTADIGIKVYGKNPKEIFINAAAGMFSIIADTGKIKPKERIEVNLEAKAQDELLVEWLRELLYQYNTTGVIFNDFAIQGLAPNQIKAIAWGEKKKAELKTEIKAVTYHELEFKQEKKGYQAKVIFDV